MGGCGCVVVGVGGCPPALPPPAFGRGDPHPDGWCGAARVRGGPGSGPPGLGILYRIFMCMAGGPGPAPRCRTTNTRQRPERPPSPSLRPGVPPTPPPPPYRRATNGRWGVRRQSGAPYPSDAPPGQHAPAQGAGAWRVAPPGRRPGATSGGPGAFSTPLMRLTKAIENLFDGRLSRSSRRFGNLTQLVDSCRHPVGIAEMICLVSCDDLLQELVHQFDVVTRIPSGVMIEIGAPVFVWVSQCRADPGATAGRIWNPRQMCQNSGCPLETL
ncbi:hypothetical protein SAMN05216252_10158 [Actinacidiphila glaucinigra]|uniref:Uncharacterized protein n=1 Tax=Actinacidiphila glaucinigra TaxID=235986 RepID=A0A238Z781_9ACTN|nr:hypothetical protein SAMN05216252_10158 [Actinacidiphila glaucinigra]